MKQGRMIQSIILPMILCVFSIQSETNHPQNASLSAQQEAQIAELVAFAEDALVGAFNSLQRIEKTLTEIALLVKKGLFKGVNPSLVMQVLTDNKMTVNALLQNQASIIALKDPLKHLEVAFIVSEFCNAFIPYLSKQIVNNFKRAKPFNLNRFLKQLHKNKTRSNLAHLEPAALGQGLHKNNTKLSKLDHVVQNIGLTWYNKAARKLDKWVVTPANHYYIPTIATYAGMSSIFGLYSLWKWGYLVKKNENVPESIRNVIKWLYEDNCGPVAPDRHGNLYIVSADSDDDDQNWYGTNNKPKLPDNCCIPAAADWEATELMLNHAPLATLASAYILNSLYKTWSEAGGVRDRLAKYRDEAWNLLRGGEYLNTFQPGLLAMKPTVSFKDMVGLDEIKEEFYQILQYINNPEQLMRIGATPEKGWLLTGPTRTGKSFSVECLFGEIELIMQKQGLANKMKFFNIGATLVNEFGIKAILDEVAQNAPAVIFLDEIDLLGLQRVGNNKLLSEFLTAMQSSMNADPSKVVIIIAATNNPENIDKALRQNGRFGKEIRFEAPSKKYRMQFITRELTSMALNLQEFDVETLANKTNGKTFEDLKRIIRNAMTRSWMQGVSLTQGLLEKSIDTEIHNLMMFNRKDLPENERRIIATHFAGRALAALNLETNEQLDKITIYARMTELKEEGVWENYSKKDEKDQQKKIEYGAYLSRQVHDTINAKNESIILNEATLLLAGFAAEELLLGSCGFTCHRQDRDKAYKMIEDLIFGGLNQEAIPKKVREELKNKTYVLLKQCHENAMKLLVTHREALVAVADELLQKQILNDKEIRTIVDSIEKKTTVAPEASAPAVPDQAIDNTPASPNIPDTSSTVSVDTIDDIDIDDDIFDEAVDAIIEEAEESIQKPLAGGETGKEIVASAQQASLKEKIALSLHTLQANAKNILNSAQSAISGFQSNAKQTLSQTQAALSDMIAHGYAKVNGYITSSSTKTIDEEPIENVDDVPQEETQPTDEISGDAVEVEVEELEK